MNEQFVFLAEQDGIPEAILKESLITVFSHFRAIHFAFLLRVRYRSNGEESIALCIRARTLFRGPIVKAVQRVFAQHFNADQFLDIIFISKRDLAEVGRVCMPFYIRGSRHTSPEP